MADIINFPGHCAHHCKPGCDGCQFCTGGLFLCTRCGSFEGATTSHCPGSRLSMEQEREVYEGRLDFVDGTWKNSASPHSPAYRHVR
jgi:hypothetical protein